MPCHGYCSQGRVTWDVSERMWPWICMSLLWIFNWSMLVMLDIGGRRIVRKMQCQAGLFAGSELLKLETIINQLKKKVKEKKKEQETIPLPHWSSDLGLRSMQKEQEIIPLPHWSIDWRRRRRRQPMPLVNLLLISYELTHNALWLCLDNPSAHGDGNVLCLS